MGAGCDRVLDCDYMFRHCATYIYNKLSERHVTHFSWLSVEAVRESKGAAGAARESEGAIDDSRESKVTGLGRYCEGAGGQ